MRLTVFYKKDTNEVKTVRTFDSYKEKGKSEEEILDACNKYNNGSSNDICRIIEIPDEFKDIFYFLTGGKEYKVYSDIEDIDDSLNELSGNIRSVEDDIYSMSQAMERVEEMFKTFKKKFVDENSED